MGFDFGKALDFGITLVLTITIVILFTFAKKWYDTPSERPSWLISIISLVSNPVTYNKLTGMSFDYEILDSATKGLITLPSSTSSLSDCASNCTNASDCLGFVYSSSNCFQVKTDFGKLIMIPTDGIDTYVKNTSNLPKWGYMSQPAGNDYAFASNVSNQQMGSIITLNVTPSQLSYNCDQTSNCLGFSYNTSTSNAWLINSTSNVTTTSNVQSYLLTIIPTYSFSNVTTF